MKKTFITFQKVKNIVPFSPQLGYLGSTLFTAGLYSIQMALCEKFLPALHAHATHLYANKITIFNKRSRKKKLYMPEYLF